MPETIPPTRSNPSSHAEAPSTQSLQDRQRLSIPQDELGQPHVSQDSQSSHWEWLFSRMVNKPVIRDLVFITWKMSLFSLHSLSRLFQRDFSIHLLGNPIPNYFDHQLKKKCADALKACFIKEMQEIKQCPPSETLLAKLSTLRIPNSIRDYPLFFGECEIALKETVKNVICSSQTAAHPMPLHLWVGLKESPPAYVFQQFPETIAISPDFINALASELRNHNRVTYLHFHGEFGGIQNLEPVLESLQNNRSVIFIQLSPNSFSRDQIQTVLPRLIQSTSNLKQLLISSEQESPPPSNIYWQELTNAIIAHPALESIIIRSMGNIPEQFREQIIQSGKYFSVS